MERIGGFGGKSDVLAQGEVFAGRADFYKVRQQRIAAATGAEIRAAAARWLADGDYTLEVHPFPDFTAAAAGVDRSKPPEAGTPTAPDFPALQRATLSNGLKIVLAERRSIPQVRFDLLLDAGFASDQFALPGTASLAMSMLDEGTRTPARSRSAIALPSSAPISEPARAWTYRRSHWRRFATSSTPSLELFADVVLHPAFRQADVDRLKKQRLAQIQREKADPVGLALRVFPRLVFGEGHAYANPWSGSGTEASTQRITRADLVKFHETWFKPNHGTLIVVGATTMAEIRPRLERLFAGWTPGDVPRKNIGAVAQQPRPSVYLFDRPGSLQSVIIAGNVAPPKSTPDEPAIETMSAVLGSDFGSRLNMNLREDKHWSYGACSFIRDARGQRPFLAYAPVQTDKTKEGVAEVLKELRGIVGQRPVQPDELERAKASLTLTLPGSWETMGALAGSIGDIVSFGLDDRYFDTYADKYPGPDRGIGHRGGEPDRGTRPPGVGHRRRPGEDRGATAGSAGSARSGSSTPMAIRCPPREAAQALALAAAALLILPAEGAAQKRGTQRVHPGPDRGWGCAPAGISRTMPGAWAGRSACRSGRTSSCAPAATPSFPGTERPAGRPTATPPSASVRARRSTGEAGSPSFT